MATEREAKLSAPPGFVVPDLTGAVDDLTPVVVDPVRLTATYYDTPDLRLTRGGVSLRHRTGGDERVWTVKLPDSGAEAGGPVAVSRREINVPGGPNAIPRTIRELVQARARTASLGPVGRLVTERGRVRLCRSGGQPVIEIDDDEVSVLDGRRVVSRFREIEVEQVGDAAGGVLERVVARLQEAGAGDPERMSKIVRALGDRALEPDDLADVELGADATVADLVRAAVTAGTRRLVDHDPCVRLGDDPEDVHQARVATRRLRSDLRTFRRLLDPEWANGLREELQWAGRELGAVRDADVLEMRLRDQVAGLPEVDGPGAEDLLEMLAAQRQAARQELAVAMGSRRYVELLDRLAAASAAPKVLRDLAAIPAAQAVADLVRRPWKHLSGAVDGLAREPETAALHEVRIRAKRLRYALEAIAPVAGKPARRWASKVADVQDILGDMHDAVVAEAWLRAAVGSGTAGPAGDADGRGPVERALAAGQLVAVQRRAAADAIQAWRPAWKKASSKALRRSLIP